MFLGEPGAHATEHMLRSWSILLSDNEPTVSKVIFFNVR